MAVRRIRIKYNGEPEWTCWYDMNGDAFKQALLNVWVDAVEIQEEMTRAEAKARFPELGL